MTLKKYLFLMIFATLMCWGGLIMVLLFINPYEADVVGFLFFYTALFLSLAGFFSILGFVFRWLLKKNEFVYNQVKIALRQALLLALLLVMVLFLQAKHLLVWWNVILLILLLSGVEYGFIIKENKKI